MKTQEIVKKVKHLSYIDGDGKLYNLREAVIIDIIEMQKKGVKLEKAFEKYLEIKRMVKK